MGNGKIHRPLATLARDAESAKKRIELDRINPSEIVASSEFHGASRIDMILRIEREDRLKVA